MYPISSKSIRPQKDEIAEVYQKGKQNIDNTLLQVWTLCMDEKYLFQKIVEYVNNTIQLP